AIFVFAIAWKIRQRWRAPLAGLLFFAATLLPLLGFFKVSFFRFSYVADHFQYLPILGIVVPVSAGAALVLSHVGRNGQRIGYGLSAVLLATLATLSWKHSHVFRDAETCYRDVVAHDPGSWAGNINLGVTAEREGSLEEAAGYFQ